MKDTASNRRQKILQKLQKNAAASMIYSINNATAPIFLQKLNLMALAAVAFFFCILTNRLSRVMLNQMMQNE